MLKLKGSEIMDPLTEAHFILHKSFHDLTGLHGHDFFEFFVLMKGQVRHNVNGTSQLLPEGSIAFIRPDDAHYYEKVEHHDCQIFNVAFPQNVWNSLLFYIGSSDSFNRLLDAEASPTARLSATDLQILSLKFHKLAQIPATDKEAIKIEVRVLLLEVIYHYFYKRDHRPDIPEWLNTLYQQMKQKENFTEGLQRLYELSPMGQEHTCRSIKKTFGKTPTEWINEFRLQYAANLLHYTDEEIVHAAMKAGFDNLSHFYHLFKRQYQMSPAKYRQLNKKNVIPD